MEIYGDLWRFMMIYGDLWRLMKIYGDFKVILWWLHGIKWDLMGFTLW